MSLSFLLLATTGVAEEHRFDVRDSIELTTFSDPSTRDTLAPTKFSPDGNYFAVVSTRGLIASNRLESTLWVFDSKEAIKYARAGEGVQPPLPRRIARMLAIPQAQRHDSYGALITAPTWSADSRNITFLGENAQGHRQLYGTDITHATTQPLTGMGEDIGRFSVGAETIVYAARTIGHTAQSVGTPINSTAAAVTGLSMSSILFSTDSEVSNALKLGVVRHGRSVTVPESGASQALELSAISRLTPAISPDGRAVIVARRVPAVPASWEAYQTTMPGYFRFHAQPGDAEARAGSRRLWPS